MSLYPGIRVRYVSLRGVHERLHQLDREQPGVRCSSQRYRDIDILLIDDIQFLQGKDSDAGGVLPHLQHAARPQQAGRDHQRRAAEAPHRLRGPHARRASSGA